MCYIRSTDDTQISVDLSYILISSALRVQRVHMYLDQDLHMNLGLGVLYVLNNLLIIYRKRFRDNLKLQQADITTVAEMLLFDLIHLP